MDNSTSRTSFVKSSALKHRGSLGSTDFSVTGLTNFRTTQAGAEELNQYDESLLSHVGTGYERIADHRCCRVFYTGVLNNPDHKQNVIDIHRDFVESEMEIQRITGALLIINNRYLFHVLELENFESLSILFNTIIAHSLTNLSIPTFSDNSANQSRPTTVNSNLRRMSKSSVCSSATGITQFGPTSIISNQPPSTIPETETASLPTINVANTVVNGNTVKGSVHNNSSGDTVNYRMKICCVSEDINREYPIWQMREISDAAAPSASGGGGGNDSTANDNSGGDNSAKNESKNDSTAEDISEPLFDVMKAMIEVGRQLTIKDDSDAATKLFQSSRREIMSRFPTIDKLDQCLNSTLLFDLSEFCKQFFAPIQTELESEFTAPIEPFIEF